MNEILYCACIQLEAVQSAEHSNESEKKVNYCMRSPNDLQKEVKVFCIRIWLSKLFQSDGAAVSKLLAPKFLSLYFWTTKSCSVFERSVLGGV